MCERRRVFGNGLIDRRARDLRPSVVLVQASLSLIYRPVMVELLSRSLVVRIHSLARRIWWCPTPYICDQHTGTGAMESKGRLNAPVVQ